MVDLYSLDNSLSLLLSLFGNEIEINMNGKLSPQFLMKRLEGEENKETRKAALLINKFEANNDAATRSFV